MTMLKEREKLNIILYAAWQLEKRKIFEKERFY